MCDEKVKKFKYHSKDARKLREFKQLCSDEHILKSDIEDTITDFIYDYYEQPVMIHVFMNLGGKYIVVENYTTDQPFTDELLADFCRYFAVDYEGRTEEVCYDFENRNPRIQKITYCFEVRWFCD